MTTQPIRQPQPIADIDRDVAIYLDLDDKIKDLTSQRDAVKARIAQRGLGEYETTSGMTVKVTPPNRSFNLARAVELLSEQQREVCRLDGYDQTKVRAQLPPVLAEDCMDEGKGAPRVSIK